MKKKQKQKIVFGEKGIKSVEWVGKLPSPKYGPFVTDKVYVFRGGKNPRDVDLRDLPQFAQKAGDNIVELTPSGRKPRSGRKGRTVTTTIVATDTVKLMGNGTGVTVVEPETILFDEPKPIEPVESDESTEV